MSMECTSSTIQHTRRPAALSGAVFFEIREPVIRLSVSEVLGRELSNPVAPLALSLAAQVFRPLREKLGSFQSRTAVSRTGDAVLTFIQGRRYAVINADADGELVLTLTDRSSTEEAEAAVLTPNVENLLARIKGFLER